MEVRICEYDNANTVGRNIEIVDEVSIK